MTICQAFGCSNKPNSRKGLSFFQIPDPKKRLDTCKKWLHNIKNAKFDIKTFVPNQVFVVCEEHFEPESFEENRQAALLGYEPRCKKLRQDAVPTIFSFKAKSKRRESTVRRLDSARKRDIVDKLLATGESVQQPSSTSTSSGGACCADDDGPTLSIMNTNMSDSESSSANNRKPRPSRRKRKRIQYKKGIAQSQVSTLGCQTDLSFTSMCDQQTQTDDPRTTEVSCGQPEDTSGSATREKVFADHTYSTSINVSQSSISDPPKSSSSDYVYSSASDYDGSSGNDDSDSDLEGCDLEEDFDYSIDEESSSEYTHSSDSESTDDMDDEEKMCIEKKYIVFDKMLDGLLYALKCPFCVGAVESVQKSFVGSMIRATIICTNGHIIMKWSSQPTIGQAPVGNLLGAAAILFSGNTYSHISHFANLYGLQFFGQTTYYETQKQILVPAVNTHYLHHMSIVQSKLKRKKVKVSGDGRCDSPGYNAKYGSYTLMNSSTQEILAMALVQVSEVKNSNAMELAGCQRTLDFLKKKKIKVVQLATDRHTGITKLMREKYSKIEHQYDVWHLTKSIKKTLTKKAKRKENDVLLDWIKSISNQVWFACQNCSENSAILTEKIQSIQHHIINIHQWDGKFTKHCEHAPLTDAESNAKKWLTAGSPPHKALQQVLFNKRLVKDFPRLTKACHTGQLEVFHSLLLKYCPKRQEFDYPQMLVRLQLAVLDHNNNLDREQATCTKTSSDGSSVTVKRYRYVYSKLTKMWVTKKIMEGKTYNYMQDIMVHVLKAKKGEIILTKPTVPKLPANIAPIPKPSQAVLLANADKSRFMKK